MSAAQRLTRPFFQRDSQTVAKALLGQRFVRIHCGKRVAGIIVETEAYLGIPDKSAHTFGGRRTPRNEAMWHDGGTLYVYFTYGMHHCMNVVAGKAEQPVAVLIRALEPVEGLDAMREHRRPKAKGQSARPLRDTDLCSGPAKTCQAMGITRDQNGIDLVQGRSLFIERVRSRTLPSAQIATGPRVGIAYAQEWATRDLRFWVKNNPHVSR